VPAFPPFRWNPDSRDLFPDVYAKSGKWFRGLENCFVGPAGTKHWREYPNEFSRINLDERRPDGNRNRDEAAEFLTLVGLKKRSQRADGR
jgi:hypothetical protein